MLAYSLAARDASSAVAVRKARARSGTGRRPGFDDDDVECARLLQEERGLAEHVARRRSPTIRSPSRASSAPSSTTKTLCAVLPLFHDAIVDRAAR